MLNETAAQFFYTTKPFSLYTLVDG